MKIDHIGIWVRDLDKMIDFYLKYFKAAASEKYHNPSKNFTSCFIDLPSGPRLELMYTPAISDLYNKPEVVVAGYAHIAISLGSESDVNRFTSKFRDDGFVVLDGPRRTGDGFYESVILDPEGNRIELTV